MPWGRGGGGTILHPQESDMSLLSIMFWPWGILTLNIVTKEGENPGEYGGFWHPTLTHGGDSDILEEDFLSLLRKRQFINYWLRSIFLNDIWKTFDPPPMIMYENIWLPIACKKIWPALKK